MKHNLKITIILLLVFVFSQIIGLTITSQYINHEKLSETGTVTFNELPFNMDRPAIEDDYTFIYIMIGVLLGTGILLLLIKFKKSNLWKLWYGFAVVMAVSVSLAGFMSEWIAFLISLGIVYFKILRPNVIVHNLSELLIYGGIAAIFVPVISIFSGIMLLILISIYDAYAVWKSKHMIKLANFQTESKLFAGLSIPYSLKDLNKSKPVKMSTKPSKNAKPTTAILGGGDIAFPLLFSGVILKNLLRAGVSIEFAFLKVMIITVFTTSALAYLLFTSKRGKFYPAMPFISVGCLIGYGVMLLI